MNKGLFLAGVLPVLMAGELTEGAQTEKVVMPRVVTGEAEVETFISGLSEERQKMKKDLVNASLALEEMIFDLMPRTCPGLRITYQSGYEFVSYSNQKRPVSFEFVDHPDGKLSLVVDSQSYDHRKSLGFTVDPVLAMCVQGNMEDFNSAVAEEHGELTPSQLFPGKNISCLMHLHSGMIGLVPDDVGGVIQTQFVRPVVACGYTDTWNPMAVEGGRHEEEPSHYWHMPFGATIELGDAKSGGE